MLHAEGVGILRNMLETRQERVRKAVGDLQGDAQQHREDEKHGHLGVFEERERLEAQNLHNGFLLRRLAGRAMRKREGIAGQGESYAATDHKLCGRILETEQIDNPHGDDEADGAEHADGREGLHRIHASSLQSVISHSVRQCQRRHIKGHGDGIEAEKRAKLDGIACIQAIEARRDHGNACNAMADSQHFLCRDPFVSHDANERRHENGDNALYGVEDADVSAQAMGKQKGAHTGQIRPPDGKLEEIHDNQSDFQVHCGSFYDDNPRKYCMTVLPEDVKSEKSSSSHSWPQNYKKYRHSYIEKSHQASGESRPIL